MRRKVRKSLTLFMALAMFVSLICGREMSAFAEDVDTTEQTVFETEGSVTEATDFPEETLGDQTDSAAETDKFIPQETESFEEASGENAEPGSDAEYPEEEELSSEELVEYQPENQPYGFIVKAQAAKDVLPEGAFMTAEELSEGTDAYDQAEEALKTNNVEFDGFKALDISFFDVAGNKIEPAEGTVQVSLELDMSLFPEEVDTDTVAVQHLDESTGEIQVQTVADRSDETGGTVTVDGDVVKADFAVESFSSFTITWQGFLDSRAVIVKYVDQNGTEINYTQVSDVTVNMGETVNLEDYAYDIDGYTYQEARLESVNGKRLTQIQASWSGGSGYRFRYSDDGNIWTNLGNNSEILLIYSGSTPIDPPVVPEQQLSHDKYVTLKDDGTYDLTLTVSGAVGSETHKQMLDVIYVLDKSGSMDKNMANNSGSRGERRDAAGNAITSLTEKLANNKDLDVRFSLVTFSSDALVTQGWTSSKTDIKNSAYPRSNGGTNYQAGIRYAKNLLESKRQGAVTAVIFVSDGNPTAWYGYGGSVEGGSETTNNINTALSAAKTEVGNLGTNYFFTVGVGPSNNYARLRELNGSAQNVNKTGFYEGTDTTTLNAAFDDIQASITQLLCSNVVITDTLSENVQIVEVNGGPKALTVTVKDADGNEIMKGENGVVIDGAAITAVYNSETKQITLDFPDDYELKQGYTYMVTANIDATEKAYENYRINNNQYPDTGEAGTGDTSAGQKGVFTNTEATVTYTFNNEEKTEPYAKPVIQLHPGTLTIKKEINGLEEDAEALAALENQLVFKYTLNSGTEQTVTLDEFSYDESADVYVYAIKGLSPNTSYSVIEEKGEISPAYAYDLKTDVLADTGIIIKDGSATAVFKNTYTPSNRNLIITKKVDGNMGDTGKSFEFTMEITKDGKSYSEDLNYGDTIYKAQNGKYSFSLKNNERIEFNLPYGCQYKVSEIKGDHTTYVTINEEAEKKQDSVSGTLTDDTILGFRNNKEVVTPTGIVRNVFPFIMMVVIAIEAIICFVALYLKKRIR